MFNIKEGQEVYIHKSRPMIEGGIVVGELETLLLAILIGTILFSSITSATISLMRTYRSKNK